MNTNAPQPAAASAENQRLSATSPSLRNAEAIGRRPDRLGFLSRIAAAVRNFFDVEFSTGEFFFRCRDCGDFHGHPNECPRLYIADCIECVDVVPLDSYGWCREGGRYHVLANRRPRNEAPSHKREVMRLMK